MKDSEINEAQRHILDVLNSLAGRYDSTISAQKLCDLSSVVLETLLEGIPPTPEDNDEFCPKCGSGNTTKCSGAICAYGCEDCGHAWQKKRKPR